MNIAYLTSSISDLIQMCQLILQQLCFLSECSVNCFIFKHLFFRLDDKVEYKVELLSIKHWGRHYWFNSDMNMHKLHFLNMFFILYTRK